MARKRNTETWDPNCPGGSLHAIEFGLQLATVEVCMHSVCDLGINGKCRILPQFSTSFGLLDISGDKHESGSSLGSTAS